MTRKNGKKGRPKNLISIEQARAAGMEAVRQPQWAFVDDRLELGRLLPEFQAGKANYGPWTYLMSPQSVACGNETEERQPICIIDLNLEEKVWEEYRP